MEWKATDFEAVQGPLRYSVWPLENGTWAFGVEFIPTDNLIFSSIGHVSRKVAKDEAEKMASMNSKRRA